MNDINSIFATLIKSKNILLTAAVVLFIMTTLITRKPRPIIRKWDKNIPIKVIPFRHFKRYKRIFISILFLFSLALSLFFAYVGIVIAFKDMLLIEQKLIDLEVISVKELGPNLFRDIIVYPALFSTLTLILPQVYKLLQKFYANPLQMYTDYNARLVQDIQDCLYKHPAGYRVHLIVESTDYSSIHKLCDALKKAGCEYAVNDMTAHERAKVDLRISLAVADFDHK